MAALLAAGSAQAQVTTRCATATGSVLCSTNSGGPTAGDRLNQAGADLADTIRAYRQSAATRRQADALEALASESRQQTQLEHTRRYNVAKLIGQGDCPSAKRLAVAYNDLDILQQTVAICGPVTPQ